MSSGEIFGRNYLVRVTNPDTDLGDTTLEIRPPFNISFTCNRSKVNKNNLTITLYGLGKASRTLLRKRIYEETQTPIIENGVLKSSPVSGLSSQSTEGGRRLIIELFIGYGSDENLRRIFTGEVRIAENKLSESGFETEIQALANTSVRSQAFSSRTIKNRKEAIKALMGDAGLEIGNISLVNDDYIRAKVIAGKPMDVLEQMADNVKEEFFEDDGKGYFIPVRDPLNVPIVVVDAKNGLRDTPTRNAERVEFKCSINPRLVLGGKVKLESTVDQTVNGIYEILDLIFVGDFEGGSWVVSVIGIIRQ